MSSQIDGRAGRRPGPASLAALLGLRSDSTIAQLRWAYERALAKATRDGDTNRAEALSRAYDALPAETHRQLGTPVEISDDDDSAGNPAPPRLSVARPAPAVYRSTSATSGPRNRGPQLTYIAALVVIVVGAMAYAGTRHPAPRPAPPASVPGPAPTSVTTTPTAGQLHGGGGGGSGSDGGSATRGTARSTVQVPLDAPHDNHGLVRVVCDPLAAQLGYTQFVPPGATVRCNNGAVPSVAP